MARHFFQKDDMVEVMFKTGDFAGGFYGGVITTTWPRRCEVHLDSLLDPSTGKPMIVIVKYGLLRPVPPTLMVDLKEFDLVDVWYHYGWWKVVTGGRIEGTDLYHVTLLEDGTSMRVYDCDLRITQRFAHGNPPKWKYNKR